MTQQQARAIRSKCKRRITRLRDAIWHLQLARDIYLDLDEVIKSNSKLTMEYPFTHWLSNNYVHRLLMGIRRIIDPSRKNKPDAISLPRLLRFIKDNPKAFSFAYIQKRHRHPKFTLEDGQQITREFAIVSSGYLDVDVINDDLVEIDKRTHFIIYLIDKWFAHFDNEPAKYFRKKPKLREAHELINYLEKVTNKYHFLITGSTFGWPGTPRTWKSVLEFAWIEKKGKEEESAT
jgi:hypothetical protein